MSPYFVPFLWREQFDEEYAEKMKEYKVQIKEWKKRKKLKVDEYKFDVCSWEARAFTYPLHLVLCRKDEQLTKEMLNRANWLMMVKVRR